MFLCCQDDIGTEGCQEFYHTTDRAQVAEEVKKQEEKDV